MCTRLVILFYFLVLECYSSSSPIILTAQWNIPITIEAAPFPSLCYNIPIIILSLCPFALLSGIFSVLHCLLRKSFVVRLPLISFCHPNRNTLCWTDECVSCLLINKVRGCACNQIEWWMNERWKEKQPSHDDATAGMSLLNNSRLIKRYHRRHHV